MMRVKLPHPVNPTNPPTPNLGTTPTRNLNHIRKHPPQHKPTLHRVQQKPLSTHTPKINPTTKPHKHLLYTRVYPHHTPPTQ